VSLVYEGVIFRGGSTHRSFTVRVRIVRTWGGVENVQAVTHNLSAYDFDLGESASTLVYSDSLRFILPVPKLEGGGEPLGRARRPGGGRKRVAGTDPGLKDALLALVDPASRGDPESPLRWTTKSTRHLAAALTAAGHPVSAPTVAALLKEESFSLQGNVKTLEGARHSDRDAQFRYINAQARDHMDAGDPVISVDAKKKENVGPFKKGGAEWQPKGAPEPVNVHDFIDKELGKVTPYGVYDVAGNAGWVSVGTDHDTAAFAVATIRTWWDKAGQAAYPDARRLLITADGGGSNGYRTRLWKTELARLAAETGLKITVCHLPPGTSKWNKIEHRLFSQITMNWRGRPLTSHEVIVNTIAATATATYLVSHGKSAAVAVARCTATPRHSHSAPLCWPSPPSSGSR
jgi:hypothetical protein